MASTEIAAAVSGFLPGSLPFGADVAAQGAVAPWGERCIGGVRRNPGSKGLLSGKDFILPDLVAHAENGDPSVAVGSEIDDVQLRQIFRLAKTAEQPVVEFCVLGFADQQLERRRYLYWLKHEPKKGLSRESEKERWLAGGPEAEENLLAWYERKQRRRARGLQRKANRLANCCVSGRRIDCSDHPFEHVFYGEFHCQCRYCRRCGEEIFKKLFGKYVGLWLTVKAMLPRPGFRSQVVIAQLDFTARNLGRMPTSAQIGEFNRDIRECVLRVARMRGLKSHQYGLLFCDEFGGWSEEKQSYNTNLHAHGLYVGPFLPQGLLAEIWTEIRKKKDGAEVVWIRKQKIDNPPADFFEAEQRRFFRCLGHALKYTGKHVLRSDGERLAELEVAFHGRRRVHTMGAFYNADLFCSEMCDRNGVECARRCVLPNGHTDSHCCNSHGGGNCCPLCRAPLMFPSSSGYELISVLKREGRRNLEEVRRETGRDRVFGGTCPGPPFPAGGTES